MSHLNEIEMQSQDVDAVIAALIKCGFTKDRIKVHKTTQNIIITLQQDTEMDIRDVCHRRIQAGLA